MSHENYDMTTDATAVSVADGMLGKMSAAMFGLLNLMTEQSRQGRKGFVTRTVIPFTLLILDSVNVLALILSADFRWSTRYFGWIEQISLQYWFMPDTAQWWLANAGIGAVILLVWFCILDALYVGASVFKSEYKRIWPIKLLRVLVTSFLTAGYIPVLGVLVLPLSCSELERFVEGSFECWTFPNLIYAVVSVLTIICFVPFALLMSLVYFDDNPSHTQNDAQSTGRVRFMDTLARTLFCFSTIDGISTRLSATVIALSCSAVWLSHYVFLPCYDSKMNKVRSYIYALYAWVAWVTVVLVFASGKDELPDAVGIVLVVAACLGGVAGMAGPWLVRRRYGWLHRQTKQLRSHGQADPWHMAAGGSVIDSTGLQVQTPTPGRLKDQHASADEYAVSITAETDDNEFDDDFRPVPPTPLQALASKPYFFEHDVELMARGLLARPSRANIRQTAVLYAEAMELFPDSVFLMLSYAYFLDVYKRDSYRAIAVLKAAQRVPSSIDLQYSIFSKLKAIDKARQSHDLGASAMDMVGIIQFKKSFSEARTHHTNAVKLITQFWSTLQSPTPTTTDAVTILLAKIAAAKSRAERSYEYLLAKYPTAKSVIKSYSLFLLEVYNDEKQAQLFLDRAKDDDAAAEDKGSVGASSMGQSSQVSVVTRASERARVRWAQTSEVTHVAVRIRWLFRLGMVALLALVVASFVSITVYFTIVDRGLEVMDRAGLRRKLAQEGVDLCRSLQLAASANDTVALAAARTRSSARMTTLAEIHSWLYFEGTKFDAITRLYRDPVIDLQIYRTGLYQQYSSMPYQNRSAVGGSEHALPPPFENVLAAGAANTLPHIVDSSTHRVVSMSLWDAGNYLVAEMMNTAQLSQEQLANPHHNPSWRFVMDNAAFSILDGFILAVEVYEEQERKMASLFFIFLAVIFASKIAIIVTLGVTVFRPALAKVQVTTMSVVEVLSNVPTAVIKHMHKRYKMLLKLHKQALEGETGEDGEPSPRGEFVEDDVRTRASSFMSADSKRQIAQERSAQASAPAQGTLGSSAKLAAHTGPHSDDVRIHTVHSESTTPSTLQASIMTPTNAISGAKLELSEEALRAHDELVPPETELHEGLSPSSAEGTGTPTGPAATRNRVQLLSRGTGTTHTLDDPVTDRNLDRLIKASSFQIHPSELIEPVRLSQRKSAQASQPVISCAQHPSVAHVAMDLQQQFKSAVGYMARRDTRLLQRLRRSDAAGNEVKNSIVWDASARFKAFTRKNRPQCWLSRAILGLSFRVFGALLLLCLIQAGNYWLSMNFTADMSHEATVLNYAGRRRMLTLRTLVLSREVLLNDGQLYTTAANIKELLDTIEFFKRVHDGLRFGDAGLGLPEPSSGKSFQDDILYDRTTDAFTIHSDPAFNTQNHGVDTLLRFYWESATRISEKYNATAPPGPYLDRILADADYAFMEVVEAGALGAGIGALVVSFKTNAFEAIWRLEVLDIISLVANILLMLGMYTSVYRTIARGLRDGAQHTEDVLNLVPRQVIYNVRKLREVVA